MDARRPGFNLWNPNSPIKFAQRIERDQLYPIIDVSRGLHSSRSSGGQWTGLATGKAMENTPQENSESPPSKTHAGSVDLSRSAPDAEDRECVSEQDESHVTSSELVQAELGPPLTDLDFNISQEAFDKAKAAPPGTPESFWTYSLYRGPSEDGVEQKVKVHYCTSKHTTERVCRYFLQEKVIGFDLEWAPDATRYHGVRRNVSLIQIASPSRIALFHVALFNKDDFVAPTFRAIMEDQNIIKAGVSIKADCTRLKKYLDVDTKGIFELSHLYKLVKYSKTGQTGLVNKKLVNLATQVQEHLHLPLFKGQDVRSSEWWRPLNMSQIIYSASDAYAGLQLYHVLEKERQSLVPRPPRPHFAELNLPIRLADGASISTADEGTEAPAAEENDDVTTSLSVSFVASVRETVQIESEPDTTDSERPNRLPSRAKTNQDSRIAAAEKSVSLYSRKKTGLKVQRSALRAYYLWIENRDMTPEAIAALLRNPPLQTATVVGYILSSISSESLPFPGARLISEVLSQIPKEIRDRRYSKLVKSAQNDGTNAALPDQ